MEDEELIKALQNLALYTHPIKQFTIRETHISWVLLTGYYAYKIKKPLTLGFVDFSTLEKRHHFCLKEYRLNLKLAPMLYLDVVHITGSPKTPKWGGSGTIIEYAVKMKQFDEENLLSNLITHETLTADIFYDIAKQISDFHQTTAIASAGSHFGNEATLWQPAIDNFNDCKKLLNSTAISGRAFFTKPLDEIKKWTEQEFNKLKPVFSARKQMNFIRACHGDLHLGNIFYHDKKTVIFDCIEFNDDFRFIDVVNEIAFLTMDLFSRNKKTAALLFLNYYFDVTGDYEGVVLLRFYMVYRAMVRAKVSLLMNTTETVLAFDAYLKLALNLTKPVHPLLIITFGVSGSGKTHLTHELAPHLNALRIRSDVERKRLFPKLFTEKLYSAASTKATFDRLANLTNLILHSGFTVIVDATFLQQQERQRFKQIALEHHVPFLILACTANETILKDRITKRLSEKKDASDATLDVLEMQLKHHEPLTTNEQMDALVIETDKQEPITILVKKIETLRQGKTHPLEGV